MKDKELIELTLRTFKGGHIDQEYAVNTILERYTASKRFNYNSFYIGFLFGFAATYILLTYVL